MCPTCRSNGTHAVSSLGSSARKESAASSGASGSARRSVRSVADGMGADTSSHPLSEDALKAAAAAEEGDGDGDETPRMPTPRREYTFLKRVGSRLVA